MLVHKKKVCNRCLLSFHQWLRLRWIIWYYFPDVMRKKSPSKVSIASSGASKWNQLINNFTNETENQQRLSSFNASFRQGYTTTTSLSLTRNVLLSTVGPVELYEFTRKGKPSWRLRIHIHPVLFVFHFIIINKSSPVSLYKGWVVHKSRGDEKPADIWRGRHDI